jgi:2-methylisocitrate lyase-like PEP mutase family enzyme
VSKAAAQLRAILALPDPLIVPGIHDGLSARLVHQVGFRAAFVSGAGVSMSRLGLADLAFLSLSDLCDSVRAMSLVSALPLIVDIDTGYGNAHNAAMAVRLLERAGAAALQIEDQTFPKRCGHIVGKQVIPVAEMAHKIRAACSARANPDTMIFARTDTLAVNGLADALLRCDAFLEAGADGLFVEAPLNIDDMRVIAGHVGGRAPLVHNFVEGGKSPIENSQQLAQLGYKIGLFPLATLHAGIPAQQALLAHLLIVGDTKNWSGPMADLSELNKMVGLPELLEASTSYVCDETYRQTQ